MNDAAGTGFKATRIEFRDSMITWAGESHDSDVLALGMKNGDLRFFRADGGRLDIEPQRVVTSSEAINGAAFVEFGASRFTAASTRAEFVIHRYAKDGRRLGSAYHEGGAHGVHATGWGGFLAPLGRDGLLSIGHGEGGCYNLSKLQGVKGLPYFYKLASLGLIKEDKELWVAAGGTDGLLAAYLGKNGAMEWIGARRSANQPSDYVGVCSIGNPDYPRAVAGLGRDRTLFLSIDLLGDHLPLILKFSEMRGKPYELLCSQSRIFIHTKFGIYIFNDIVSRFLQGESLSGRNPVRFIPHDCFDFNIAFDHLLLLLDHRGINLIEIADLDLLGESKQLEKTSMNTVQSDSDWEPNKSIIVDHSESSSLFESDLQLV